MIPSLVVPSTTAAPSAKMAMSAIRARNGPGLTSAAQAR